MPELPDIATYIHALEKRIIGEPLLHIRIANAFLLRTADPPVSTLEGQTVREIRRIGKRIAIGLDGDLWLVVHLMIAGRLHWKAPGTRPSGKFDLAAFEFPNGTLVLTEAGAKRRASIHIVRGEDALLALDPGGIDVMSATVDDFRSALTKENHTLKRALTDPRVLSGIGNAYSDEILHAAKLSPIALTQKLSADEWRLLLDATHETLQLWTKRLQHEAGEDFPKHVTAFHDKMAVHGRYNKPCPTCGEKVQRIRYADNETNYCAKCQTDGKVLADRALSRLLGADFPRTLEDLEALHARGDRSSH
ncbi:MAG: formamidopyrimidine-DNA glycosylase [Candidatus Eremiobacteraeota bacterium]|nr:formamidopyrimidine-DNA glycosylase [Candidatus Eremiobacteraeota bacterium]